MAKYEVKDINKNGVEDDWEIAKYAKANAAAEGSPAKMTGMLNPNQMQLNPYPNQNALGQAQASTIPGMMGQNIPGTINNVMPNNQ
mgnify:FL=1